MVRWMPCHSPMNTKVMRSLTAAFPFWLMPIVSWYSAMRQLLACEGTASSRTENSNPACRDAAHGTDTGQATSLPRTLGPAPFSELHGDWFAISSLHLEELTLLETEHSGDEIGREGLNLRVQVAHDRVVIAARILDRVFNLAQ